MGFARGTTAASLSTNRVPCGREFRRRLGFDLLVWLQANRACHNRICALRHSKGDGMMPAPNSVRPSQPQEGSSEGTGVVFASLAAVGSVLAASSCCLPILPFVAAAGVAGGTAFLSNARPYLLILSIVLVAGGFFQVSRVKACRRKPSIIGSILLWLSTAYVAIAILFPQVMANAAAAMLGR